MEARTVTTSNQKGDLKVVTRELFGKDRVTDSYIRAWITNAVYPRYGWKKAADIENAVYNTIIEVAEIIVQTVSLEGDWHGLVLPSPSDQAACIAFYDALAEMPDRYTALLLQGVRAANKEPENPTGSSSGTTSQSAPVAVLTKKAAS